MPPSLSPKPAEVPVVIVGGGLSGLSAAAHLTTLNVRFLLLEAQSRLGGRVHSVSHTPSADPSNRALTLELGATWFHGTVGNAAYEIAVSSGVVEGGCDGQHHEEHGEEDTGVLVCSAEGRLIRMDGTIERISPAVSLPIARAYAGALEEISNRKLPIREDISVEIFARKRVGYDLMGSVERAIVRTLEHLECCVDGCNKLDEESASMNGDYKILGGGNELAPKDGMGTVVEALRKRCRIGGQVEVGREVATVEWGEDGVVVQLKDMQNIKAECVIWTPSLNVTKKAESTGLFRPGLPREKVEAMQRRGMGAVEKVFAVLGKKPEGVENGSAMPVYWERDVCESAEKGKGPLVWMECVYAATYLEEIGAVCLWLHGAWSQKFCRLDEGVAAREVGALLTLLYGTKVVVEGVVRSEWGLGEFTLGSYSFPATGAMVGDVEMLAQPLPGRECPRLCFAGEATHERFYSTMHGAVEAGEREAEVVARFLGYMETAPP